MKRRGREGRLAYPKIDHPTRGRCAARGIRAKQVAKELDKNGIECGRETIEVNGQPAEEKQRNDDNHDFDGLFKITRAIKALDAHTRPLAFEIRSTSATIAASHASRLAAAATTTSAAAKPTRLLVQLALRHAQLIRRRLLLMLAYTQIERRSRPIMIARVMSVVCGIVVVGRLKTRR